MDGGKVVTGDRRTSLIIDPPDGRIPWTPEGRERFESDSSRYGVGPFNSWVDADTGERCLTDGLPFVPLQGYNMNYHILQGPGWVAMLNEMFHEYRLIPTDGRSHVPAHVGQWLGDARGRWEGETLVVETTSFADKGHYLWRATWRGARPTLHLVERFTRVDETTLDYEFTMTDPAMFTSPLGGARPDDHRPCLARRHLPVRCSSTPATKETTVCSTSFEARGRRKRNSRPRGSIRRARARV